MNHSARSLKSELLLELCLVVASALHGLFGVSGCVDTEGPI